MLQSGYERLQRERHVTERSSWIEWAEYCPFGDAGFFFLKGKAGQQQTYLYERMPRSVWDGFVSAPSAGKYYDATIRGARFRFLLSGELKPDAPELTCGSAENVSRNDQEDGDHCHCALNFGSVR